MKKRAVNWSLYIWYCHILPFYHKHIWWHFRGIEIGKLDCYTYSGGKRYESFACKNGLILDRVRWQSRRRNIDAEDEDE